MFISKLTSAILMLAIIAVASAQYEPVAPADAQQAELGTLSGVQVNGVTLNPELDVIGQCIGLSAAGRGFVDKNGDGIVDTLVQFGSAMATADQYASVGIQILGSLRTQATLRAQSEIVQTMAVLVSVDNNASAGVGLSGADGQGTAIANTSIDETLRSQAVERLVGATSTGTRFVSLPGDGGVCLLVRYEAPLRLNNLGPVGRSVTPPPPAPAGETGGSGYETPPTGSVGDF